MPAVDAESEGDVPGRSLSPADLTVLKGYEAFAAASPIERLVLIRRMISEHPEGRLLLPPLDGNPVVLDEIELGSIVNRPDLSLQGADLRGARLRHARLIRVNLAGADLRDAALGGADLRGANLEGADLRGADLAGARLNQASLGGADFRGTMLEEADLRKCQARFTQFGEAILEHADLRRADLWGALFSNAALADADLRGANLTEADFRGADLSRVDFRRAVLGRADLSGAKLVGADLQTAECSGANFRQANLRAARLQGLDLLDCDLTGIQVGEARLDEVRFRREQLGGAIGEELAGAFVEAREGYLSLERAFADQGDHDAAVWAYLRRRRMQKHAVYLELITAKHEKQWGSTFRRGAQVLSDQLVEWICDYGESVPRVMLSLLILYLVFTVAYGLTGSVAREETVAGKATKIVTTDPEALAIFSLLAMSTGDTGDALVPTHDLGRALVGIHVFLWVALTGLLGFVLGNRIRR